ncbi:MAG: galactose mutarotase [Oscillospiraceae bacterium]|nr:galactose mutarotase [Oscillospiraceae bacterium]
MVRKDLFGEQERFTISSESLSVSVISTGAAVTDIRFCGKKCALGYDDPEKYAHNVSFLGAAVGRYANRIARSQITLDGREYSLTANEGINQLHGGPGTWAWKLWTSEILGEDSVRFSIEAPDGENGFPGTMQASVTYTVRDSALRLDFEGSTDKTTVFAPTTHIYFALDENSALETEMRISASSWLEVDSELIPTGKMLPCEGAFDFSALRKIGQDFDHCFVLNEEEACTVRAGGVTLRLKTDFPGLQLYTGKHLGSPFGSNGGFAVEPEFFPDSPHHPEWPSPVLRPGEIFRKYAEFTFT